MYQIGTQGGGDDNSDNGRKFRDAAEASVVPAEPRSFAARPQEDVNAAQFLLNIGMQ